MEGSGLVLFCLILELFGFSKASGNEPLNNKSPRYAALTHLTSTPSQIQNLVSRFNKHDNMILNLQEEDGMPIEPEFYAPIIPMVLVNGAEGIGTGFSTKIPNFNPVDIINNLTPQDYYDMQGFIDVNYQKALKNSDFFKRIEEWIDRLIKINNL